MNISKIIDIFIGIHKKMNIALFLELNLNEFIKYLFLVQSLCYTNFTDLLYHFNSPLIIKKTQISNYLFINLNLEIFFTIVSFSNDYNELFILKLKKK